MPLPSLLAVALGALALNPPSVPAKGSQQTILTVDRTTMVRLSTVNPAGTACEIVDHLRGPFASSGVAGRSNCDLDLLLDAGVYKVRLTSPRKGKGSVTVKAEAFQEINSPLLRLEPGRALSGTLKPRQQASFWIHLDQRGYLPLRVSGRTAGDVRLWRNGEWLENLEASPSTATPASGRPIHEWWVGRTFEAGDYLLTVYGTNAQKWSRGPEENGFSVAYLWEPMPPERVVEASIPAWGVLAWSLPKARPIASLELAASPSSPVELSLHAQSASGEGGLPTFGQSGSCRVEAKALRPTCTALGSDENPHSLVVRGPPGAKVRVEWASYRTSNPLADGDYAPASYAVEFRAPESGRHLLALNDVPADPDGAPLGCTLERYQGNGHWQRVARDFLQVGPKKLLERAFNYDRPDQAIWFEVTGGSDYAISTSGGRKNSCELYRLEEGGGRSRLTETSSTGGCKIEKSLGPGAYELKLYGGDAGIETLTIVDTNRSWFGSNKLEKLSGQKTGCLFASVPLEKLPTRPDGSLDPRGLYRLSTNRHALSARGLVLKPHPLALDAPFSFELPHGSGVELPAAAGRGLTVSATGALACALGRATLEPRSSCALPEFSGTETLSLTNKAADPVVVTLYRPPPPRPLPPLQAWNPTFEPLPVLGLEAPVHFDFARAEEHSLVFEVKEAGLYHLSSAGLLATACRIRTPATLSLAENSGGGRGRNCLVAGYLRPGRYLATVQTVGESRGRGGVALARRPSRPGPSVTQDGQAFFRVEADTLIEQKLEVKATSAVQLETLARGAALSCRLEDKDGWPVLAVPTPCQLTRELAPGQYLWLQLPLTVESMRRTVLEKVQPPVVLKGGQAHPVGYNRWYTAKLGKSGKDEFVFDAETELDVQLVLTDGMQGRLYRFGAGNALVPVEFIAPQQVLAPPEEEAAPEGEGWEGEPSPEPEPSYEESSEGEAPPEEPSEEYSPPAPAYAPAAVSHPSEPTGQALSLGAGRYKLILEHSRENVDVTYRLYLRSDTLAPGIAREVTAPTKLTVRVPREGVLRLRTSGETDVRCRLYDAAGRLAAESSGLGDDWNCAIAAPIAAGEYSLVLESETLSAGPTRVAVTMPKIETAPALAEGASLKIGAFVVQAPLPEAVGDVVQEISLASTGGAVFSCDVSGPGGVIARRSDVKECAFLLRAGGEKLQLRAWTFERLATVGVHVASKPVQSSAGGRIASGQAALAHVLRDGRYRTDRGVFCLPEASRGALLPCGPEVSLEKGPFVFASLGAKDAKLPLDEVSFAASELPTPERVRLEATPWIQTARSKDAALHLVRVAGLSGERSAPACRLGPGARVVRETDCFAASALAEEATLRLWTAGEEGEAELVRFAVRLPKDAVTLAAGRQTLTWKAPAARLALPPAPARVELVLPPGTWAVQLDDTGRALDLCPPEKDLARCAFASRGGQLALWGEGERRAEASVVLGETPARARLVAGLFEAAPRLPGFVVVDVPAADAPRRLEVEGARGCSLRFADGRRAAGCAATLPANQAAELVVEHDGSGVRALAHGADRFLDGLFPLAGARSDAPGPLTLAQALPLVGAGAERTLELARPTVVHLRADSGVCGLARDGQVLAAGGLGAGCAIDRLLEPGSYRVLARPFDGQPLTGAISWTESAVETLADGVGPERFAPPGGAQLYRFALASAGRVGIGVQQTGETLECAVRDAAQAKLGDGCQQFLKLEAGSYLLEIRAPQGGRPMRYRPVVVGLSGSKMEVPEEYLRDLFNRIGGLP